MGVLCETAIIVVMALEASASHYCPISAHRKASVQFRRRKSALRATTCNIVFKSQYTLLITIILIKYDKVYKGFCILSLILGISGHTINYSEINYTL